MNRKKEGLDLQFKMRMNKREKNMIHYVSKRLKMNHTDTIKTLVIDAYKLAKTEAKNKSILGE